MPCVACEGRGGPLTHALTAGCPVVTTSYRYAVEFWANDGGTPPGIVVPCGSVEALGGAIDRLLTSPTELAAARAGADALGAHLTWDRVVAHYVEVLTDAMSGLPVRGGRTTLLVRRTRIDG